MRAGLMAFFGGGVYICKERIGGEVGVGVGVGVGYPKWFGSRVRLWG